MLQTFSTIITNKVNYFAGIFTDKKKNFSCIVNHFVHFGVIVLYEDNTNTYGIPNLDCLLGMVYQQQLALLGDTLKESEKASESTEHPRVRSRNQSSTKYSPYRLKQSSSQTTPLPSQWSRSVACF